MLKLTKTNIIETSYDISEEAKMSSLFGIGNGYYGIRGSLEEFGDVFIQGLYIRGLFDKIVEIPQTFADNIYMKRYYFDVQKLKEFEYEDSTINVCDPLTIRFIVNGKLFLPWEGKIIKWNRYIDTKTGGLIREVIWDDGDGNLTKFNFERYASFDNHHLIIQKASVQKINHNLPIEIVSGIDTLVKTNGQHKSAVTKSDIKDEVINLNFYFGDHYKMSAALSSRTNATSASFTHSDIENGVYGLHYDVLGDTASVTKITSMYMSRDPRKHDELLKCCVEDIKDIDYVTAYKKHLTRYKKDFDLINVKIKGNQKADVYLRYANYQTLIGIDRFDSVHSLSAKNLTAEKYNQFVWWDCEIYQLPIPIAVYPKAARACLEYRYRCLEEAKKKALKNGYKGAQFAFCSSYKGDEQVWIYARHPFLQIHISCDVAYGIYNYYSHTNDIEFMKTMGLEMMEEVCKFFISRSTYKNGKWHILNVTGTDEHHDYIDDNAYTNYLTKYVFDKFLEVSEELGYEITKEEKEEFIAYKDSLYLPQAGKRGIIPQFEGYLDLKPYLPLVGNGAAKGFQMKSSGLYHQSQIIKQPDLLNLYTVVEVGMDKKLYKKNWHFYEEKCEASSSLTYPTHAICAIEHHENDKYLDYFFKCLELDFIDHHNCAYQGVHAACLAGGWYSIYRGILGIVGSPKCLTINPIFDMPFESIEMKFYYHGSLIKATLGSGLCEIKLLSGKPITISYQGKERILNKSFSIYKKHN